MSIACSRQAVLCTRSEASQRQTRQSSVQQQAPLLSRRTVLHAATIGTALQVIQTSRPAAAKPPPPTNTEADNETSPYIQDLLAKSKEKKKERALALLKDYNRRNFKDYFQFEAGGNNKRGLSEDTQKQIQQWLKDNQ